MKINSEAYWDQRFQTNWEESQGSQQTNFFAGIALELLPIWFLNWINDRAITIADWGCAFGEGAFAWSQAFPNARLTGIDVSASAIDAAKNRFPNINFRATDWQECAEYDEFDIVFSSNTLEHFEDPWHKADLLAQAAKKFVILLLPYREFERIDEHAFTFDGKVIPLNIGNGEYTLMHSAIDDCSVRTPSYWIGEQILLIYVRNQVLPGLNLKLNALSFISDSSQSPKLMNIKLVASREELRRVSNDLRRVSGNLARREFELSLTNARLDRLVTSKSWRWTAGFRKFLEITHSTKLRATQLRSTYKLAGIKGVARKAFFYFDRKLEIAKQTGINKEMMHDEEIKLTRAPDMRPLKVESPRDGLASSAPVIVMLVENFFDGGLERVVIDLCVELRKRGLAAWILVANTGGRAMVEARQMGLWVEECRGSSVRVENLLTMHEVKVVLTHCCYSHFDSISKLGIPLLEVLHNAYFWNLGDERLHQLRLLHISRYIAVSESAGIFANKFLHIPKYNLDIINNGLNPKGLIRPPAILRAKLRRRTDEQIVLVHTASFGPQKRHALVLAAFEKMAERYTKLKIVLAGSSEVNLDVYQRVCILAKASKYSDRIEFAGVLDRREVSQLLASSHIALLPSAVEGFSIASLEFAYFGIPCVLSDTGAAREFIDKFGHGIVVRNAAIRLDDLSPISIGAACWDVSPSTVNELTDAIESILSNYDYWIAKGEEAAMRWKEYSVSRTADQYFDVLGQFVNLPV
jgi:glycosyltransferase involved in cell wall biosynthesis